MIHDVLHEKRSENVTIEAEIGLFTLKQRKHLFGVVYPIVVPVHILTNQNICYG